MEKILRKSDYQIFRIPESGKIVPLKKIENQSDPELCNYMFVPEKEIESFESL